MEKFAQKFELSDLEIFRTKYWTWSLRPKQVTLGSGIISLNRKCTQYSEVTPEEHKDFENIIKTLEKTLKELWNYDKINYLMLMMEDEQIHFHVFPRYKDLRIFNNIEFKDDFWPKAIELENLQLNRKTILSIKKEIKANIITNKKFRIGYTTGVFDMFHVGHLNLLRNAKSQCDYLIVGVTTDELVSYKNQKAIISHEDRMEIVKHCIYVDEVVSQSSMNKMEAWEKLKFDSMFVGSDWKGTDTWKNFEKEFSKVGVEIVYFPYTKRISSTKLRKVLKKKQE